MEPEAWALRPFGLLVETKGSFFDLDLERLKGWIDKHKVVVLRGLEPLPKNRLPLAARRLGPLQAWPFGAVNELQVDHAKKNYLFTGSDVPLHWDGAFKQEIPHWLFFQCVKAPPADAGGETLFVDAEAAYARVPDDLKATRCRYETERVVHYGGSFEADLKGTHPTTGATVLRYAEPVTALNPVQVDPLGVPNPAAFHRALHDACYEEVLAHAWQDGDIVIADNHALLHGRAAFKEAHARHLQRVNVLDPGRTSWQWLWDSLRIRRPEFMVAEIPILLLPVFWMGADAAVFTTLTWWVLVACFFLLFHFGDMINCYADRELDLVYKTKTAEAVWGLGERNVLVQITVTAGLALAASSILAGLTERFWLMSLVMLGLVLGHQYSMRPLHFKSRGLWQVPTLWAVIFFGPMLLVHGTLGGLPDGRMLLMMALYGAMQQGTILVNTAEDYDEDVAAGLHTSAVALGRGGTVALSLTMVSVGAMGTLMLQLTSLGPARWSWFAAGMMSASVLWVLAELFALAWGLYRSSDDDGVVKSYAMRMPLWITALAWTTLAVSALRWAGL